MSRKKKIIAVVCAMLLVVAGTAMVIYPMFATRNGGVETSKVITAYKENIETAPDEELLSAWEAADAYNHGLYSEELDWMQLEENGYGDLLDMTGTGIMGYIVIPKIDVNLPIYHGTSQEALAMGAGHYERSSLPVGGVNTHSVITAHSGMASARMFSDLPELELGDTFKLIILGETLTYEVDDTSTVLPSEIHSIGIKPGEDLCTLITCTPIGVNSHRLLVRGHRIETPAATEIAETEETATVPTEEATEPGMSPWERYYYDSLANALKLCGILLIPAVFIFILVYRKREKANAQAQDAGELEEGDADA